MFFARFQEEFRFSELKGDSQAFATARLNAVTVCGDLVVFGTPNALFLVDYVRRERSPQDLNYSRYSRYSLYSPYMTFEYPL